MEELGGWLLLIFIGGAIVLTLIFFAVWILIAILARIFSLILLYWVLAFLLSGLVGIGLGVILPVRVLTGKGRSAFWQIRPEDVVAGKVVGKKPLGPNREYGWDNAWPNYLPYQALQDAVGVVREASTRIGAYWTWIASKVPRKPSTTTTTTVQGRAARAASATGRAIPRVLWYMMMLPIFVGWALGVWISVLGWMALMVVVGGLIALLLQMVLLGNRLYDQVSRRGRKASLKCPLCYNETSLPGYRCSNEACDVIHWTVLPGPLGLFTRRCSCGTQLPNTVRSAAARLETVCPFCNESMAVGSGMRHTIQIPVIGSIGAGKSRLLDRATVELSGVVGGLGGAVVPLSPRSETFLESAVDRSSQKANTPKTAHVDKPVGLPFIVQHRNSVVEAQIMDVAGEAFATWETTTNLRYLDNADALLFVLDPLGLPDVNTELKRSKLAHSVLVASGDQEEAYGTPIDRMRADQVPIAKRDLAVVLTKGDILTQLPIATELAKPTSAGVREWLNKVGADLLVRRFEKDFRTVTYFLVDSMNDREIDDPLNPWWVLDWALRTSGSVVNPGGALYQKRQAEEAAAAAAAVAAAEAAAKEPQKTEA